MKSDKNIDTLEKMAESSMRWLDGEEVTVFLDWDDRSYYVWCEPTWNFEHYCEEQGLLTLLSNLRQELDQIGVQQFFDLVSVNAFCRQYCGDNDPSEFYIDETFPGIIGA